MDTRQILLDTASALRDFVQLILAEQHGENWIKTSGLPDERIELLESYREQYMDGKISMQEENRLINYTNFSDLKRMIERNWEGDFELAFGDKDTLKVFLNTLQRYTDPDSHSRSLLTHQKHLILGISGFLRNRIIVYRSWKEGDKIGFPKIESVRDNLGNLWVPGKPRRVKTGLTLQVGDSLEFVISAKDPEDHEMEYRLFPNKWTNSNVLLFELSDKQIGKQSLFSVGIKSMRKYHAFPLGYDDRVTFEYEVVPRK